MAREAPVAVILRRGPTKLWRVVRSDTRRDQFQRGHWFRDSFYPERCDLSPDGRRFLDFAGKSKVRDFDPAHGERWTAVSYAPHLTALALWPIGDCWSGGGAFVDNETVVVKTSCFRPSLSHHPLHPPGPRKTAQPWWKSGWIRLPDASVINRHAAAIGGRLKILQDDQIWTELLNLEDDRFEPIKAPDWAKRWEDPQSPR